MITNSAKKKFCSHRALPKAIILNFELVFDYMVGRSCCLGQWDMFYRYRKDTEPLYNFFMYSLVGVDGLSQAHIFKYFNCTPRRAFQAGVLPSKPCLLIKGTIRQAS